MNFETHDHILFADWTFKGSLLSREAQSEVDALESFIQTSYDLAQQDKIQAVLWIQKVECFDTDAAWLNDLQHHLLRDQLRLRLLRLAQLRSLIEAASIPWIYVTEKNCHGLMFEFMLSCHRRYVFNSSSTFGFPEMAISQMPPLGWLSGQINKQEKLPESWQRHPVLSAPEAVKAGYLHAAMPWREWRSSILVWAQQQIVTLGKLPRKKPAHREPLTTLWIEKGPIQAAKTHMETYQQSSDRKSVQHGVDTTLIDSAAHFMLQAPYELWLTRAIFKSESPSPGVYEKIIYIDVTEALPPAELMERMLLQRCHLCFFSPQAHILHKSLELIYKQLELSFSRFLVSSIEKHVTWFVGTMAKDPKWITMRFGYFRSVSLYWNDLAIHGWAISNQSAERQVIEISAKQKGEFSKFSGFFDTVYFVQKSLSQVPLLYKVRSLIMQILVEFCQQSGDSWSTVLEQLRATGWSLLGSDKFWDRFMEYRMFSQKSVEDFPRELGRFAFNETLLKVSSVSALADLAAARHSPSTKRGPGYLNRLLSGLAWNLAQDLFDLEYFNDISEADLYVTDALGYPNAWGSARIFVARMGQSELPDKEILPS